MLTTLSVRHFAVVEEVEIDFGPAMTVVTGETGAGKSLLVDALLLLSGARADSGMIRPGAERAELQAAFDLHDLAEARQWLADSELDEDEACQLRRVIRVDGRSRAWINGRPATLTQLSQLAGLLLEIHGQHEHQALLSRQHQLGLLDAFADNASLLTRIRACVEPWRDLEKRQRELAGHGDYPERLELLRHEVAELREWTLPADEWAALENEHKRLAHATELVEGSRAVANRLDGDGEYGLQHLLARTQSELEHLVELDQGLQPVLDLVAAANIQVGEAGTAIDHYVDGIEVDPDRQAEIDARFSRLHELSRRHRLPLTQLHEHTETLASKLEALEQMGTTMDDLVAERERLRREWEGLADELGRARTRAAREFGARVSGLMQELGMGGGHFEVQLEAQAQDEPDRQGRERCEFLVTANPGQPPRPLRKVASGGELARISLAIEVAALGMDSVGTMVFDEVDSGIGGAIAEVVGQKLRALGQRHQVLCVTHLPQVAAQGHAHLRVSKHTDGDAASTRLTDLDDTARRDELARMLGGIDISRETRAHARKMLEQAQQPD